MTSSDHDWPADAKDPRKFALTCCDRVELVSSTFPKGAEVRFENAKHINPAGSPVEMMHLVFGADFDPRATHKPHEWIAILKFEEPTQGYENDVGYHLFSVDCHSYGGYIQDEFGINGWQIDRLTGAIYQMVGSFSGGRRPSRFEIKHDQWGQDVAMSERWGVITYVGRYLGWATEQYGVRLLPEGCRIVCSVPEAYQALSDMISEGVRARLYVEEG